MSNPTITFRPNDENMESLKKTSEGERSLKINDAIQKYRVLEAIPYLKDVVTEIGGLLTRVEYAEEKARDSCRAQLELYEKQVNALEATCTELKSDISALQKERDTLQAERDRAVQDAESSSLERNSRAREVKALEERLDAAQKAVAERNELKEENTKLRIDNTALKAKLEVYASK